MRLLQCLLGDPFHAAVHVHELWHLVVPSLSSAVGTAPTDSRAVRPAVCTRGPIDDTPSIEAGRSPWACVDTSFGSRPKPPRQSPRASGGFVVFSGQEATATLGSCDF